MGIFDSISPDQAALMAATAASSQGATRLPQPFMQNFGNALGAIPQGVAMGQAIQGQNTQNQMSQLALQRQKAILPYFLSRFQQGTGGMNPASSGVPGSMGNVPLGAPTMTAANPTANGAQPAGARGMQMLYQGLLDAYATGDPAAVSKAELTIGENDPDLVAAKTSATQGKTLFKMADDTYQTGDQITGAGANPLPNNNRNQNPPGIFNPSPMSPDNAAKMQQLYPEAAAQTNVMPNPIPGTTPPPIDPQALKAQDGKPIIPTINNAVFYKPDPNRLPDFTPRLPANATKVDVENVANVAKDQTDLATKQYEGFGTLQNSLENEKYYAERMADIYRDMSSPNAAAQYPEIAQKAYNLGLISDPKSVKNLADVQEAINTGAKAVLSNIKDTAAGLDPNHPMRIFGSEVNASMETAIDPSLTPQARYNSLLTTLGLVNRNLDGINSYNSAAVGGLGNRLNGGKTMSPSEYMQQFVAGHDAKDYRNMVASKMAPFGGMAGNNGNGASRIRVQTPDGKIGTIDPAHLQALLAAGGKVVQ